MSKLKVYVAGSMSLLDWATIKKRFNGVAERLRKVGFMVMTPLLGKQNAFDDKTVLAKHGYEGNPLTKQSSIINRDQMMVENADFIFANLTGVDSVSIGTMFELAWAYKSDPKKHIVVVMDKGGVHDHAFIHHCCTVFYDVEEALCYMEDWQEVME